MNSEHTPNSGHSSVTDELQDLIAARCHGIATAEQCRRLNELLASDSNAIEYYVNHMTLHSSLRWLGEQTGPNCHTPSRSCPSMRWQWKNLLSSGGAIRTVRVLFLMLFVSVIAVWAVSLARKIDPAKSPVLAWEEVPSGLTKKGLHAGDHVRQEGGAVRLIFGNGVQLSLFGKADLELVHEKLVILHAGQVQIDVGMSGRGFTVKTPSTSVVDLGTVFGVSVTDESDTNVVVFSGEVKLGAMTHSSEYASNLFQGEAIRVNREGHQSSIREIWIDQDGTHWSTHKNSGDQSPIRAVTDNRRDGTCSKYYSIVLGGFGEDVLAYGDRPYEWNSLPGVPLPKELVGADYIRTFNDTKFEDPLEIVIDLSLPAKVYVLMDPRHERPDWLISDFTKTDFKLGVDLRNRNGIDPSPPPPLGIRTPRYLGKGPGVSVDAPFEVWVREMPMAGKVHLGPNGRRSQILRESISGAGSMYGIVVTPLNK